MNTEQIKRYCVAYFDRLGITMKDAASPATKYESDLARFNAWGVESLHAACEAIENTDDILALRCTLQVYEYKGRAGGFMPGPHFNDAALELRNHIENIIRNAERMPTR